MERAPSSLQKITDLDGLRIDAIHRQVHDRFRSLASGISYAGASPWHPVDVWCVAKLPEAVRWHSAAIHEAAHSVLAFALGLTPQRLTLAAEGEQPDIGGGYIAAGDPERQYPHQHIAVMTLGAGPAQARHLHAAGYTHPELRSCVTEFAAAGDVRQIEQRIAENWLIDRAQARVDAKKILTHPVAAAAVEVLAGQLVAERDLDAGQIAGMIGACGLTGAVLPSAWAPGRRLPVLSHSAGTCAGERPPPRP
uniref:hypothetical protein n=1 Tax=Streptomyces sp. NBC_01001 TaxID=2903713 RepID=UPI002F910BAB|nr:hypothetical protein OG296_43300 [Streptomyces sp. NBC_01001]